MKGAYPIILTEGKEKIIVYVPDFGINTEGADIADAMYMARDAIALIGIDMEDDGASLPAPSTIAEARTQSDEGSIVTLVDVDFTDYRRRHDMTSVRKNCTIPSWLNREAEAAGLNFSKILQEALKSELQLT